MTFFTIIFLVVFSGVQGEFKESEKTEFCDKLKCDGADGTKVCGLRNEGEHLTAKVFENECLLLKYGCEVNEEEAYGIINMEYCTDANSKHTCDICPLRAKLNPLCALRREGEGFRIRLFLNECQLIKYNCEQNVTFEVTQFHICKDLTLEIHNDIDYSRDTIFNYNGTESNEDIKKKDKLQDHQDIKSKKIVAKNGDAVINPKHLNKTSNDTVLQHENDEDEFNTIQNIIVVDGSMMDKNNINASIDAFFASTHLVDMPLKEVGLPVNLPSRRKHVKLFSPIKVYKPYVVIPKNISEDHYHEPTLGSCFHKCPTKCPDTYAPVCGKPGIAPREPSLMFKNHCFMDKAQCKMYWEAKSPTSLSAYYIESAFLFCLGDELYSNYRFLPLIRTLQHMGRLKKKSSYHYRVKNMKFLNNMLKREPRLMG